MDEMSHDEAAQILEDFGTASNDEAGEYWTALAEVYRRSDCIDEGDFKEAFLKHIVEEAQFIRDHYTIVEETQTSNIMTRRVEAID